MSRDNDGALVASGDIAADALDELSRLRAVDLVAAEDVGEGIEDHEARPEFIQVLAHLAKQAGGFPSVFLVERHQQIIETQTRGYPQVFEVFHGYAVGSVDAFLSAVEFVGIVLAHEPEGPAAPDGKTEPRQSQSRGAEELLGEE
jgi:hypothetical protein